MLRSHRLWLATVAITCVACGSDVFVIGGGSDGPPCEPHVVPGQEELDLRVASPGTFIGDLLHLDAIVNGKREYVVLQIDAGTAFLVGEPDLAGRSALTQLGGNRWIRAANESTAGVQLDVVDVTVPLDPVVATTQHLAGAMPPAIDGAIAARADHAYYCRTNDEARADLVSLDLTNPAVPGEVVVLDEVVCNLDVHHAAPSGSLWLQWDPGTGYEMSSVYSYALTPTSLRAVVDFGFNPTGVHSYGRAERAATDGRRIVVDTASDHWILVYDDLGHVAPEGPYQTFPLGGSKRLLAVYDQLAYFAMDDGIHALDVASIEATATDFVADTGVAPEDLSLVAVGRTFLAVADGDGRLYLVDRSRSGPVPPARAFRGPPAETTAGPGGC